MEFYKTEDWDIKLNRPILVAGPCSAESEEQVLSAAIKLSKIISIDEKRKAVHLFRAGIWKPRTRPTSFEGVGDIGLQWLKKAKEITGLPVTVEVASVKHIDLCLKNGIDVLWIGARTTANPFAVQEIANALKGVDIPVLIKNPINPDIELWIGAIERIYNTGIKKIIAVHRGFSSYEKSIYRNEPNWSIPIELKRRYPNLPIICDPSHICGKRENILAVCQKAIDLCLDGWMIEVHNNPAEALSDQQQQISPENLQILLGNLILRRTSADDVMAMITLEKLREHIDKLDFKMLELLFQRMDLVGKIGNFKKENNITIFQPERWNEIFGTRTEFARQNKQSQEWVIKIFELIHEESIRKQIELMNLRIEETQH